MNLTAPQLLELLTYNGAIDGISLMNHPWLIDILNKEPPGDFHIEYYTPEHPILWTANGWIDECKRKKEMQDIELKFKEKKIVTVSELVKVAKIKSKRDLLRSAMLRGDIKEIMKLKLEGIK